MLYQLLVEIRDGASCLMFGVCTASFVFMLLLVFLCVRSYYSFSGFSCSFLLIVSAWLQKDESDDLEISANNLGATYPFLI